MLDYDEGEVPPDAPRIFIGQADEDDVGIYVTGTSIPDDGNGHIFAGSIGGVPTLYADGQNPGSHVLAVVGGQFFSPLMTAAWTRDAALAVDGNGRPQTASATFVAPYMAVVSVVSNGLYAGAYAWPGAGSTMEARVTAHPWGDPGSEVTLVNVAGITTPSLVGGGVYDVSQFVDGLVVVQFKIRRTAGASNVAASATYPVIGYPT
jgi:hypothetical protein